MIGSLMSRMSAAQNYDVPTLQKAIQDGTLPAYVGIPLIQDKMKQQQMAQAGAQGQQQQKPPIAEQILAQAAQSEGQKGIDAAQSNLQGMSGGGIAYAAGGDVDEDYADQQQEMQDQQDQDYATMMMNQSEEPTEAHEPAYVNKTPNVEKGIKPPSIDALLSHIVRKESGGRNYDDKGKPLTSSAGAKFAMQVMPATASDPGFGIKPAQDVTPEEYNRVGKELATALLNKYQNPVHAAAAYNWGSKNVDKWLAQGADPSQLPKETRGYIQGMNMAEGGIVALAAGGIARFYEGGDAQGSAEDDIAPMDVAAATKNAGIANLGQMFDTSNATQNYVQSLMKPGYKYEDPNLINQGFYNDAEYNGPQLGVKPTPVATQSAAPVAPAAAPVTPAVAPEGITQLTTPIAPTDTTPTAPKEKTPWEKYMDNFAQSHEDLKNQKAEDKYMALMAAGLGILKSSGEVAPGKVHTALGDIASGGLEGVSYAQQAAKQRAAQEAALNKEENIALYRDQINKVAADKVAAEKQRYEAANAGKDNSLQEKIRNDMERAYKAQSSTIDAQRAAAIKANNGEPLDPQLDAQYERQKAELRSNLLKVYKLPEEPTATYSPIIPKMALIKIPSSLNIMSSWTDADKKAAQWANENPYNPKAHEIKKHLESL